MPKVTIKIKQISWETIKGKLYSLPDPSYDDHSEYIIDGWTDIKGRGLYELYKTMEGKKDKYIGVFETLENAKLTASLLRYG